MTTVIDQNNVNYDVTALDDTDSTYQGEGEEIHTVDTTNGTLTVELRDSDTTAGFHKRFIDIGGNIETNAVTFQTQSSQNIDGSSTVTWDHQNNSYVDLWSDGSNWFTSLQESANAAGFDGATIIDTSTDPSANGEIRQNSGDVKVYSGGAVRSFSSLGQQSSTTSTVTATGGSDPADEGTINDVASGQTAQVSVRYNVNSDPAFNADYGAELSWWTEWDESESALDIGYQLVWQTDPGSSNDVDYQIEIVEI